MPKTEFKSNDYSKLINKSAPKKSISKIIKIKDIVVNDLNDKIYDAHTEQDILLKEDIRLNGLLQPILVKRHSTLFNKYELIGGHRRLKACLDLEMVDIEAKVKNPETERDALLSQMQLITTNFTQRERTTLEKAREAEHLNELGEQLRELGEEIPNMNKWIAKHLGVGVTQIKNYNKINKLDESIKEDIQEGKTTAKEALKKEAEKKRPKNLTHIEKVVSIKKEERIKEDGQVISYVNERVHPIEKEKSTKKVVPSAIDTYDYAEESILNIDMLAEKMFHLITNIELEQENCDSISKHSKNVLLIVKDRITDIIKG